MARFVKVGSLIFAVLIIVYSFAVTHPTNALSHKACTSWEMVKDKSFMLTHYGFKGSKSNELPVGFTVKPGTAKEVPVLMYHYITPKANNREPGNKSVINLEAFEENMEYLHDEGYYTATLEELEQYVLGEISLPEKSIVLTFDDGYQNNYIYAYPTLKKYGFHATIFMIGSKIEEQTVAFDPNKKSFLSRAEIDASQDVFEYHSHTYDLHRKGFPKCGESKSLALDTTLLQKDIQTIKATGIDTPYFAYPFGEKSRQMIYDLKKNGYRMAFTVRQGFVKPGDPLIKLNRLTVTSRTNLPELLEHKVTPQDALNLNSSY